MNIEFSELNLDIKVDETLDRAIESDAPEKNSSQSLGLSRVLEREKKNIEFQRGWDFDPE